MAKLALNLDPNRDLSRLRLAARSYDHAHPQVADAAAAAGLAAITVPWVAVHTTAHAWIWICNFALALPLVWRRRHPVGVLVVLAAIALVQWLTADPLLADVSLLAAVFTVALERPGRTALAAGLVVEVGAGMASIRWHLADSWDRSLIGLTGLISAALFLGAMLRSRRAHLAQLTERAARLELERDHQAQIAAAAERSRIAREMHDVIAHSLAVMITMADGASAKLRRDPETAAKAIASISDVGRQALADTRRLLGVLRDSAGPADLSPQPGLDEIDVLIHKLRSAGLVASVSYSGHLFPLAPGAELTIYRVVQEAATNTLKHSPAASSFDVVLDFAEPAVRVEVTDDGTAAADNAAASTGGHGLAGMRERVALYHGRVRAGPRPVGGWAVEATLELAGADGH